MERFDTIVIGGGPAGLMAAGRAAETGERVLLVEKNNSLGEKLLLAGKRRCSITNAEPDMELFLSRYGENGNFLREAFGRFGPAETIAFFNKSGIKTKVERGNRVFPHDEPVAAHKKTGAQRILDSLLLYCKKGGVRIFRDAPVKAVKVKNSRIEYIVTGIEELSAGRYILATGGKSYPETGSTGDGYRFAAQAGHTIVEPTPAIVSVRTQESWVKLARNFKLRNVRLTAMVNDSKVGERFGEMEFTSFGVSGPVVMDISASVPGWMKMGALSFILDMKPALDEAALLARIERDFEKYSDREFRHALVDLLPGAMIPMFLELSDVPPDKLIAYVSPEEHEDLARLLKNVTLTVTGLHGFEQAIITKGGVNLGEVEPATLRSKLCENLYFAGEILDLNGPAGGFNLQICWSTGRVAGQRAGTVLC